MSELWQHFQEGGWAMYPVFVFGLTAVGAAGRFAWRGEHQLLGFIRWVLVTLLASGGFGFTVGMMMTLTAAQQRAEALQMARIVMVGSAESANNLAAVLMFAVVACALVAVGQRRFPLPNPSAVAR